jgi:hypothetical protein
MNDDPAFASAIEKAYLDELSKMDIDRNLAELALHGDLMERAVYRADPTNGGLRFKRLPNADELEARLLRALSRRLRT